MGSRGIILALWLAGAMAFAGCGSNKQPPHERLVSPVQQDMSGMRGYDMPKTDGAPMPAGWKGFRAY
jgi:hypothetical protein